MNLNLIRQKLLSIEGYIDELEPYLETPLEEYLKEAGQRRVVERLSQLLSRINLSERSDISCRVEGKN